MIKVTNEVDVYERNGKEPPLSEIPKLLVMSHFAYNDRVVLKFGEETITVMARDLDAAIMNATRRGGPF